MFLAENDWTQRLQLSSNPVEEGSSASQCTPISSLVFVSIYHQGCYLRSSIDMLYWMALSSPRELLYSCSISKILLLSSLPDLHTSPFNWKIFMYIKYPSYKSIQNDYLILLLLSRKTVEWSTEKQSMHLTERPTKSCRKFYCLIGRQR